MRKLSLLIVAAIVLMSLKMLTPSPHGKDFKISCSVCHSSKSWAFDKNIYSFDHNSTSFPLVAQHAEANCKTCHPTLVFSEAKSKTNCVNCHNDVHEQTVGTDCSRCHTPESWIVENVTDLHLRSRFPLLGKHAVTDCYNCHQSVSLLRFDPLRIECYDCHSADYAATTNPNHAEGNIPTTCDDCHMASRFGWTGANFNHSFFPLTGGHAVNECSKCHTNGNYSNTPNNCVDCHQSNYNSTTNPNHQLTDFSTNCADCHTTDPGWKPAEFRDHDSRFFPIYSGNHAEEWNTCSECHTTSGNFSVFSCTNCHEHSNQEDVNSDHEGVGGYIYESNACYQCHPQGNTEGGFDHNASAFPLTGAHTTTACKDCHTNSYSGTSTVCSDCHINNYNQSTNPNHQTAGIPTLCSDCHTTTPGWKPAEFPIHNNYFVIDGAHTTVAENCQSCHNGNYASTPNTCAGCHINNYNQAVEPNHVSLSLSTDCAACHTTNPGWSPATFAVHNTYYLIEGAHSGLACNSCHITGYTNTPNTCYGCHATDYNQTTNPNHASAQFPTDCASCHSQNAWTPATFNHDPQYFPIYSGKHQGEWNACSDCHTNSANYSVFTCTTACHPQSSTNEQHQGVGGYIYTSEACLSCHPDGSTAGAFNHNSSAFPLTGGHATPACSDCHAGGYAGTSALCSDCHTGTYNQTSNPNHSALGIPNSCASCHTTDPGWQPATFAIHSNYYALTGAHSTISNNCASCHNGNYNNTPNACAGCHMNNYNQATNPSHIALSFPTDCASCHTTNPGWNPATFAIHNSYYVLQGAHAAIAGNCNVCHNGNYNSTPNTCAGCHINDYNQTNDPPHASAQFPTDCELCHTQSTWVPSTFDHDGQYFPIYSGEHNGEWDVCADCHTNPSNYAVFNCLGCHTQATTNAEHTGVPGYTWNSNACLSCHPDGSSGDKMMHFNPIKID